MSNTALILLAGGSSSRMGQPKQLLNYRGQPLIRHAVEVILQSVCRPVFVVLGANANEIRPVLNDTGVTVLENERWGQGIGTSIQCGVRQADAGSCDGAILALADQPHITPAILDQLVRMSLESRKPIVASQYAGTVGVPAYFSRKFFPHLLALHPQEGCKGVILSNPDDCLKIDCPEAATDVDTRADWERIQQT